MKKKILINLFFFHLAFYHFSMANISFNVDSVKGLVRKYENFLSIYSNSNCKEKNSCVDMRNEIVTLFLGNGSEMPHASDLFNFEIDDEVIGYLRNIEKYNNQIKMTFSESIFVAENLFNNQFAMATVDKKIELAGIPPKVVSIIICVDVSSYPYLIGPVYSSEDPSAMQIVDSNSINSSMYFKEYNFKHYKYIADSIYKMNNFYFAEQNFLKAQQYDSENNDLKGKISLCESKINYNSLVVEANRYFNQNQFEAARLVYLKLTSTYPNPSSFIAQKMQATNSKLDEKKYLNAITNGEEAFHRGNYRNAKKYFEQSLTYNAGSAYPLSLINKCETILNKNNVITPQTLNLSLTYGFPPLLEANREYVGTVVISYNKNLYHREAELEITLPNGCYGLTNNLENKDSTFKNTIKFSWKELPEQTPFMINYKVNVSSNISNSIKGKLTGSFSYGEGGALITKNFENNFY